MAAPIVKSKEKAADHVRGKRGKSGHEEELLTGGEVSAGKKSRALFLHNGSSQCTGYQNVDSSENKGPANFFPPMYLMCFSITSLRHGDPSVGYKVQEE